jgi:hypothetical protein
MAPPFLLRPMPPPLLQPIEMPTQRPMLIEQDESHEIKNGLCWLGFNRPSLPVLVSKVCGYALSARGVTCWTIHDLLLHAHASPFHLPSCGIQGWGIMHWRSICSRMDVLLHFVHPWDWCEPMMVVVCLVVRPPTMDQSTLMWNNQCLCMHLCHLYLDFVVCNKNGNVCLCS